MNKNKKVNHYHIINQKTGEVLEDLHCTWPEAKARSVGIPGIYPKRIRISPIENSRRQAFSLTGPEKELHYQRKMVRRRRAFMALPENFQIDEVAWEIEQLGHSASRQLFEDFFGEKPPKKERGEYSNPFSLQSARIGE